ncbi:MAG: hypothetical protein HYU38_04215 [Candidatus Tectomicrobia bacterium]|nr:hypothetical protein [Candidatus Tectomicrobia bacterium]
MNSPSGPPDLPTFFIDHSLGRIAVAEALRHHGHEVRVLSELFPENREDSVWLREVGHRNWAVLTKDKGIKSRSIYIQAIVRADAAAFVLTAGNLTGPQMAEVFVRALPAIVRFVETFSPPFIVTVSRAGELTRLHPPKPKRRRR